MNFIAAFILLISDANEKEAFGLFTSILEKSSQPVIFDGLSGFYELEFPLLNQYSLIFGELFKQ